MHTSWAALEAWVEVESSLQWLSRLAPGLHSNTLLGQMSSPEAAHTPLLNTSFLHGNAISLSVVSTPRSWFFLSESVPSCPDSSGPGSGRLSLCLLSSLSPSLMGSLRALHICSGGAPF